MLLASFSPQLLKILIPTIKTNKDYLYVSVVNSFFLTPINDEEVRINDERNEHLEISWFLQYTHQYT